MSETARDVTISSDGQKATVLFKKKIHLFRVNSGELIGSADLTNDSDSHIEFSPNGDFVITQGVVDFNIFDTSSLPITKRLGGGTGIHVIAFSNDSTQAITEQSEPQTPVLFDCKRTRLGVSAPILR